MFKPVCCNPTLQTIFVKDTFLILFFEPRLRLSKVFFPWVFSGYILYAFCVFHTHTHTHTSYKFHIFHISLFNFPVSVSWSICYHSLHARVTECRRVCSEFLSRVDNGLLPGEKYLARVGTWAGRFSWRGDANRTTSGCLVLTLLASMILAVLLMIGGIEQNPGPVLEVENTVLGAAGISSWESNANCVDVGIVVVVEAWRLKRLREREVELW